MWDTHTHTHIGLLLWHEKEWNNAIFSNMDRPTFIPSEVRERQIYGATYMLHLKKMIQMNLFIKQIHRHWKLPYGYQGGREEG